AHQGRVDAVLATPLATADTLSRLAQPGLLFDAAGQVDPAQEAALAALFPGAKRVRLLPAGYAELDQASDPPLSYADLEQLRAAEQQPGVTAPLEVYQFGTKQQHLNLVRAIAGSGAEPVRGVLMVSYDLTLPQQALRALGGIDGYAELVQLVSGQELVLARAGDQAHRQGPARRSEKIAGTRWSLRFWLPHDAEQGLGLPTLELYAVYAAALLLYAGVVLLMFRSLGGILRQDQAAIINLVSDILERGGRGAYPVRMTSFRAMVKLISGLSPRVATTAQQSAASAAAPASEQADPLGLFDSDLLEQMAPAPAAPAAPAPGTLQVPASIFRAYDIRGIVGRTLSPQLAQEIGRAIGSEAFERGQQALVVARDGRLSGPQMADALTAGLLATGRDVIDIGMVPTPVLYFAAQHLGAASGVMVTGSHNPPDYNGFKMVLDGETLSGQAIQELYQRIQRNDLLSGQGAQRSADVVGDYLDRITADIHVGQPLKLVIDCGNGVAGVVAPDLYRALGCEVVELFCEVDGRFPNHHPDPGQAENLRDLIAAVRSNGADLGLAFDGDGDRLGVVDSAGNVIWPDRLLMLFARDLLTRHPDAEILYDVKCSRHLAEVIREHGGRPSMCKTGHSLIKARMRESGALLAGEMSGHFFFSERWFGFDDALYAGARLLEILSNLEQQTAEVFAALPDSVNTPELRVPVPDGAQHALIDLLVAQAEFPEANVITIDGLRVDFPDGWGLVRASNTTPNLILRFEADDDGALRAIQERFRTLLLAVEPNLKLPF
ncbi:MAG TPA: phosphomannomutase/phosphoglucomutase, partial [Gammaproteobacteria bacterium]